MMVQLVIVWVVVIPIFTEAVIPNYEQGWGTVIPNPNITFHPLALK